MLCWCPCEEKFRSCEADKKSESKIWKNVRGVQKHQGRRSHGRIQRRRTSGRLQPCPSVGVPDKKDTDDEAFVSPTVENSSRHLWKWTSERGCEKQYEDLNETWRGSRILPNAQHEFEFEVVSLSAIEYTLSWSLLHDNVDHWKASNDSRTYGITCQNKVDWVKQGYTRQFSVPTGEIPVQRCKKWRKGNKQEQKLKITKNEDPKSRPVKLDRVVGIQRRIKKKGAFGEGKLWIDMSFF